MCLVWLGQWFVKFGGSVFKSFPSALFLRPSYWCHRSCFKHQYWLLAPKCIGTCSPSHNTGIQGPLKSSWPLGEKKEWNPGVSISLILLFTDALLSPDTWEKQLMEGEVCLESEVMRGVVYLVRRVMSSWQQQHAAEVCHMVEVQNRKYETRGTDNFPRLTLNALLLWERPWFIKVLCCLQNSATS